MNTLVENYSCYRMKDKKGLDCLKSFTLRLQILIINAKPFFIKDDQNIFQTWILFQYLCIKPFYFVYFVIEIYIRFQKIMGSCCPQNSALLEERSLPLDLTYDETSKMLSSYQPPINSIFEKKLYNWHSVPISTIIPIPTEFSISSKSFFQIKNIGIKNDSFLVGIIKEIPLYNQTPRPWETDGCLCLQSHQNNENCAVICNNGKTKVNRGVKRDEILKIAIQNFVIQFSINNEILYKCSLPSDFTKDNILPYVALFQPGDKIEFINGIRPLNRQKDHQ